jgi:glycosyltransferase involved in cell wall biosynthesis
MRIVHIVEPFASGIATFVRSLVNGMPEDRHIIVHGEREQVISSDEVILDFPQQNVQFIRWPSAQRDIRPIKDWRAFLELRTILRRLKAEGPIDAVHLHSSKSGFLGRLACRMVGIRGVVYTPNGAPFLGGSMLARFFFKQLERLAAAMGGKVVCCSPSECGVYREIGIDAVCINNGVSVRRRVRKAIWLKKPSFRVVTCGRVVGQKNPRLFNAIASYFQEFEGFEFLWIGDGPDRALLQSRNITVTGWLSIRETERLLSTGDIYISTSNFEGMPFAVLEALVLKKPVLLKDCVGNKDIVLKGINGDLFEGAEDAILSILRYYNNREMLPIMGEHSKHHCMREFDVQQTSAAYRQLYAGQYN